MHTTRYTLAVLPLDHPTYLRTTSNFSKIILPSCFQFLEIILPKKAFPTILTPKRLHRVVKRVYITLQVFLELFFIAYLEIEEMLRLLCLRGNMFGRFWKAEDLSIQNCSESSRSARISITTLYKGILLYPSYFIWCDFLVIIGGYFIKNSHADILIFMRRKLAGMKN